MSVKEIESIEEFNNIITKNLVCIDFWAPWCGPCLQFAPVFQSASEKVPSATFAKVNIDQFPTIAKQYEVRTIPTIILFENSKIKNTHTGRLDEGALADFVLGCN